MKRIGILGGTFNPIHMGHLTIAQMVQEQFRLDKVLFIPSHLPPHKGSQNVAAARDRYAMVRSAVRGNPNFAVSDFEIKRKGKSYSIDTLIFLQDRFPKKTKFYFIIGGDLLSTLHTWKRIDELLKIVTFVAVNRPGFRIRPRFKRKVKFITVPGIHISSSDVRSRIWSGKTVKYLVPDSVRRYIEKRRLYHGPIKVRRGRL